MSSAAAAPSPPLPAGFGWRRRRRLELAPVPASSAEPAAVATTHSASDVVPKLTLPLHFSQPNTHIALSQSARSQTPSTAVTAVAPTSGLPASLSRTARLPSRARVLAQVYALSASALSDSSSEGVVGALPLSALTDEEMKSSGSTARSDLYPHITYVSLSSIVFALSCQSSAFNCIRLI
jgi:hypothetical protein